MRLYLNERPRTFIITSNSYALIIRHPFPKYKDKGFKKRISAHNKNKTNSNSNKVVVEFIEKEYLDLTACRDITPRRSKLSGFLGLLNVKGGIYLGFITNEELVASPTINEKIYRITGAEFYCLNNDEFDYLIGDNDDNGQDRERSGSEYPAGSVRKLLSSGAFFYSHEFDVTSNIQERGVSSGFNNPEFKLIADSHYFKRFQWNGFMMSELMEFRNRLSQFEQRQIDSNGFFIIIARGYAKSVNTTIGEEEALMTLISKQACAKEGPLFGDWGCDGNGYVSNYVETEIIIYTERFCLSYIVISGNVPIYWETESTFTKKSIITAKNGKRIIFPRSFEASQHAFTRHFDDLASQFGDVHILNTLSEDPKSHKGILSSAYIDQIQYFNKSRSEDLYDNDEFNYKLLYTHVPITTSRMKKIGYSGQNPYDIISLLSNSIINFGALFYDQSEGTFIGKQLGVFRVNSFDSLSKANFLSKVICQEVIELAFRDMGISLDRDVYSKHAQLWSESEEYISKLTVNFISNSDKLQASSARSTTSSMKSHITKKYLSSVVDTKPKETAILKLLGRLQDQINLSLHNPIHDYVSRELNRYTQEYTSYLDISIFSSTFNVNGSIYDGDIEGWLFPKKYPMGQSYDLVLIGLQEIVELNPGQMMNVDFRNKSLWERKILKCLSDKNPENCRYIVMWSGQLGGLALLLYVKEDKLKHISNVECSFKKTGLGGVAANKGGVSVSFKFADNTFCFVSSHLAAGLSNVEERHQNYKTLAKGIQFSKNRRIKDHDAVIWLGDFNYRIGLPNEQVRPLIHQKAFYKLFEFDQLNKQMANGATFPFFDEMEIQFPPTYKFDNGTKEYDTGEKQRIPAWTDRILYQSRKNIIKPLVYYCDEELIFSDHRPVFAMFSATVKLINQSVKEMLSNELYENYKKKYGGINNILTSNVTYLFEDDEESGNLPAPSSDKSKWWLEGGKAAKVIIPELHVLPTDGDYLVFNPKCPQNPFEETNEPEFVSKSQLLRMLRDK
ncbi:INP51 [[Candida] subhashii]|uniref:phosphoinositide 5-phosphatase n=1 Tax=[Candida] subhashii TaxID=561895 RepID=A0A8J5QHW6_9ASCO|nr:INP51 [[Candida] subhashii]KAG7661650.1 INP51 [[Candida] subhashii]